MAIAKIHTISSDNKVTMYIDTMFNFNTKTWAYTEGTKYISIYSMMINMTIILLLV